MNGHPAFYLGSHYLTPCCQVGVAAAFDGRDGRPKRTVVDIDGDGSFMMNVQELATCFIDKLDVKVMILNKQHLGMVVQWEDRFYKVREIRFDRMRL
jgi:thiamine pyrophosphate-dependent acetolactate synthase large subunit-like protein